MRGIVENFKGAEPTSFGKLALVFFLFALSFSVLVWADELEPIQVMAGSTHQIVNSNADAGDFIAGEVLLNENSVLQLSDFKSIHIQKLIAKEGARIRLAANANGGDGGHGQAGTDGADARFFLGSIEGHIVIEARGGNGGDGLNGRNGRQGAAGKDGRKGRTLLFGLIYIGNGDDGQPGLDGEDGEDGEDGGRGGNGGNIALFYREKTESSRILIDVSGGDGGRGGAGGMAGLGGNGGKGGRGIRQGAQGAMGRHGKSGRPGRSALPGNSGEAVAYQIDSSLFQCLFELDLLSYQQPLSDLDFQNCSAIESATTLKASVVLASAAKRNIISPETAILYLSADGLDGDDAADAHLTGSTPPPGSSGAAGGHMTLLVRDLPENIFLSARGGRGGNGGRGALGSIGGDGLDGRNETWFHKGSPGENGKDGGDGGNGSDGGSGASGGHIRVVYFRSSENVSSEDWTARFNYDLSGGAPGRGGEAGMGGRGGQGGHGGKKSSRQYYPNGWAGVHGRDGKQGRDGERGAEGEIEFLEVDSYQTWVVSEYQRWLDKTLQAGE